MAEGCKTSVNQLRLLSSVRAAVAFTCDDLQRVVSQDSIPQQKQLVGGQVAREGPHHPLKGDSQSEDKKQQAVESSDKEREQRGIRTRKHKIPRLGLIVVIVREQIVIPIFDHMMAVPFHETE